MFLTNIEKSQYLFDAIEAWNGNENNKVKLYVSEATSNLHEFRGLHCALHVATDKHTVSLKPFWDDLRTREEKFHKQFEKLKVPQMITVKINHNQKEKKC